jgi:hypothetical protein
LTTSASAPCERGHYCRTGSKTQQPGCDKPADPLSSHKAHNGGRCKPGKLCGTASRNGDSMCPAGYYCKDYGMSSTSTHCIPGYFCAEGTNDTSMVKCPPGRYCPLGSTEPIPCGLGTFSESRGAPAVDYCQECPPGYVCDVPGKSSLTVTANSSDPSAPQGA